MNTVSKVGRAVVNVVGVVLAGVVLGVVSALAAYLLFLHTLAIALIGLRERWFDQFKFVVVRGFKFRAGIFIVVMFALLACFIFVTHAIGGWWLAGPLAALAVYIILADLRFMKIVRA